ncbi:MAG: shikimate kinase [Anaerovoracaceae bacterium]
MSRKICGLLGEKLSHTYSPEIHTELGDYEYNVYEKTEEELEDFFANGDWVGINVTIPYKKTVMKYCDELSSVARVIGSVNTIVRREDGTLYGDNTDAYGFELLIEMLNVPVSGAKALVLGSGGASLTAVYTLRKLRARSVIVISRTGENNYDNISRHYDADLIINTTPVGMYPDMNRSPLDLSPFKELKGVIDIIYNPARTNLIMQAESLGVPCIGGIRMLVGQAAKSAELFDNVETTRRRVNNIASELTRRKMNIVLVGMPGSGKTRIARSLAQNLGWPMLDTDEMIIQRTGRSPSDIIINDGESAFRDIEMEIIEDTALTANCIISTGGGCVTRSENYYPLHRNSLVVWIRRDLALLSTEDRPLSQTADISFMYQKRYPMYEYFSDMIVENNGSIEDAVNEIVRASGVEILED